MAIRIRSIEHNGERVRVALCAVEADQRSGDLYLDDADHYALAAKFSRDWIGHPAVEYPTEWAAMDTQKQRDAKEEHERWQVAQAEWKLTRLHDFYGGFDVILPSAKQLQSEGLVEALRKAQLALNDWVCTFAGDHCLSEDVEAAEHRLSEYGTLAYIADVSATICAALALHEVKDAGWQELTAAARDQRLSDELIGARFRRFLFPPHPTAKQEQG